MSDNVQDAVFEILKRIQGQIATLATDVSGLKTDMTDVKGRLERVERLIRKQTRDNAGMLVMMRATAGAFDERMTDLEEQVRSRT